MNVYPNTSPRTLGFEAVWDFVESRINSELGRSLLNAERPASDLQEQLLKLQLVSEFQDALRFDDNVSLGEPVDAAQLFSSVGPEGSFLEGPDLRILLSMLATARVVKNYFSTRAEKYSGLASVSGRLEAIPHLEKTISDGIDERGAVRENATPELRDLTKRRVQAESSLRRSLQQELRKATESGYATEAQPTVRGGRMVLPIRAEAKRKVQGFVHDVSATGQTVFIEPTSCLELNNELIGIDAAIRREIVAVLVNITAAVLEGKATVVENARILASLEVIAAKAKLANNLRAVVPTIAEGLAINLIAARNPELVLASESEDESRSVVPLNLELGDSFNTLIITGPNAGGKTVALKTIGLFALMLSYGIPVPADELSTFPFVENLLVDIGDQQSVENDLSTYSAHIVRLAEMVRIAAAGSIVLIDEAGTGTDPIEGGAIAQAVLESLTDSGAYSIATTHQNALKSFANDSPQISNGSMVFDPDTLSPTFQFRPAVPGSSYGLEIAGRSGLPQSILSRARELAGDGSRSVEDLLADLEQRSAELEVEKVRLHESSTAAEKIKAEYDKLFTEIRGSEKAIVSEAHAKALSIVKSANAKVEKTIRDIRESQANKEATKLVRKKLDAEKDRLEHAVTRAKKSTSKPKLDDDTAAIFSVGDLVVLDGGSSSAEVVSISGKHAEVAFTSGRMRVAKSRLQKVGSRSKQQVSVKRVASGSKKAAQPTMLQQRIDVRGQRAGEALLLVTNVVDEAVAAGLKSVEILHGKGTGALRSVIRADLEARPDVSSAVDADLEHGGSGITVVRLKD